MPDYAEIEALAANEPSTNNRTLSGDSVFLLLELLAAAEQRFEWENDGDEPTDADWDDIEALVAKATKELMIEVSTMELGTVFASVLPTAPAKCLECNGQIIYAADYPDLYAAISSAWQIAGAPLDMQLPDLRGRTIIGEGTGVGLTAAAAAAYVGAETHVLTTPEMPAHTHAAGNLKSGTGAAVINVARGNTGTPDIILNTGSTGGGTAHNNIQPSHVMHYYIRVLP